MLEKDLDVLVLYSPYNEDRIKVRFNSPTKFEAGDTIVLDMSYGRAKVFVEQEERNEDA